MPWAHPEMQTWLQGMGMSTGGDFGQWAQGKLERPWIGKAGRQQSIPGARAPTAPKTAIPAPGAAWARHRQRLGGEQKAEGDKGDSCGVAGPAAEGVPVGLGSTSLKPSMFPGLF